MLIWKLVRKYVNKRYDCVTKEQENPLKVGLCLQAKLDKIVIYVPYP